MPWQEIVEKAVTVGVTALVSGALGYVVAAFTLKRTLTEGLTAAEKRISDKVDAGLAALKTSFENDVKELKEEDLKSMRDAWVKNLHDVKGEFTRANVRVERDLQELERKVDTESRSFNEEQTRRWNEVQRSLGFIEGQLKSRRGT